MTEILILYILIKYDATIYKIKKLIEEKFFMYASPSLGAINPALKKLEELSCVVLNNASILVCISDILDDEDKKELIKNCLNNLLILRAETVSALENPYNLYTEMQKQTIGTNLLAIEKLIEVLQ